MISSGIIHDKNLHLLFCYSSTLILVELPGDTQKLPWNRDSDFC